ncbi:MAG: GNAT family N-acetyltransferase [Legionella sp.]|nr:MAG: GNAT family N-acetyltransferase [Legionella sp.]
MIESSNQLNAQQLQNLMQLKTKCKQVDGSVPNLYPHILVQSRTFPVNLFYYEQDELLGFLSVFFFYDEAVEVALLVHPSARRKGIASQLLQTIIPQVQSYGISELIFSSPTHLNDSWLKNLNLVYLNSEYCMERDDLNPLLDYNQSLSFREATAKDILILCALDEACFPKKNAKSAERFQQIFDDRNYQIFIVLQNNQPIGKAHLRWEHQGVTLSDIAILPALQAKGYGSALIAYCVNYALGEGKPYVSLDVETHNQRALNLYVRLGFVVQNACDYWSIKAAALQQSLALKSPIS